MSGRLVHLRDDEAFMRAALALGARNMGRTAPNPAVGALVVKDGIVVGRGWTAEGGRPHAEPLALAQAGAAACGATLYVTLEPCSHHGKTPPCAEAIIRAGVARVVSALEDPDPRVAGQGHEMLAAAGIDVLVGVCADAARRDHLGHILRVADRRPMVTLKLAETADGYAAGGEHDARLAITGAAANAQVHALRARHDAIMIGVGTARGDDPLMTVRLPGMEHIKPLRVVLDARLQLSPHSRLVRTAKEFPTLVIAGHGVAPAAIDALEQASGGAVRITCVEEANGRLDLAAALGELAARGLTRVWSEGGPRIGAELIAQGLADRVILYRAPKPFGRPGLPALSAAARATLADPARYEAPETAMIGVDRRTIHERKL
jgi:diaminohydroxyphosphoribosylaminopyrimidine deaminase/5-amino-6-(5-phosphoribosylamino)uracil reductase